MLDTVIPRASASPRRELRLPVIEHAPGSRGAVAYRALAEGSSPVPRRAGRGRGLAAILPASSDVGEPQFRDVPVELIDRTRPSTQGLRPGRIDGWRLRRRGGGGSAVVRPLRDGRFELIAGERRWRAARQAGLENSPALLPHRGGGRAPADRADRNMAARTSTPRGGRGPARLSSRSSTEQGGRRETCWEEPLGDLQPDPAARPARPGPQAARARSAQRRSRAGAARRGRPGRAPAARASGRRRRVVGARDRAAGQAGGGRPRQAEGRTPSRRGGGDQPGRGRSGASARPRRPVAPEERADRPDPLRGPRRALSLAESPGVSLAPIAPFAAPELPLQCGSRAISSVG